MGSSSSLLAKSSKESGIEDINCQGQEQPDKCDKSDSKDKFGDVTDNSLMEMPKQALILRIIELETRFLPENSNTNKTTSKVGLIPRCIFSEFESNTAETVKTKEILISQLENELRAQKRSLEDQKVQSKQKLAVYAAEITDLRYKTTNRIYELELELKKQNHSTRFLDHQNPLIMKLSQKINEQAQIIKELESSLARKNEIIEGFKIFESCQYNKTFETSEECQQDVKDYDFRLDKISKNTRSFVSQDLVIVDSLNRQVELSLSDENFYCAEKLQPAQYGTLTKNNVSELDQTYGSVKVSTVGTHISNHVKLPTDIIGRLSAKND